MSRHLFTEIQADEIVVLVQFAYFGTIPTPLSLPAVRGSVALRGWSACTELHWFLNMKFLLGLAYQPCFCCQFVCISIWMTSGTQWSHILGMEWWTGSLRIVQEMDTAGWISSCSENIFPTCDVRTTVCLHPQNEWLTEAGLLNVDRHVCERWRTVHILGFDVAVFNMVADTISTSTHTVRHTMHSSHTVIQK